MGCLFDSSCHPFTTNVRYSVWPATVVYQWGASVFLAMPLRCALVCVCLVVLQKLVTTTAAQSCTGEQCSAEPSCTRALLPQDATKPFCHTPNTISVQAQQFLKASAVKAFNPSTQHAAEERRTLYKAKIAAGSAAAAEQYYADIRNDTIAGVPVTLANPKNFNPAQSQDKLLVYLHGGGYVLGSCYYSYHMTALIADQAGIRVLCVEYRLAPEHPYPAAVDDAVAVYKALLDQYEPHNLAYVGDSAGGGLAVAMVQQAKQQQPGLPLPGVLLLMAPWVDLGNRGDTMTTHTALDPTLQYDLNLKWLALAYVGGQEEKTTEPGVSPLFGDFSTPFPPTLIQVGLREVFLSDCALLYRKLKAAAVDVEFSPWEAMWHVFQAVTDLPEAQEAFREMAAFLLKHLDLKT